MYAQLTVLNLRLENSEEYRKQSDSNSCHEESIAVSNVIFMIVPNVVHVFFFLSVCPASNHRYFHDITTRVRREVIFSQVFVCRRWYPQPCPGSVLSCPMYALYHKSCPGPVWSGTVWVLSRERVPPVHVKAEGRVPLGLGLSWGEEVSLNKTRGYPTFQDMVWDRTGGYPWRGPET